MLEKQSLTTLNALSPLDGRYQTKLDALRPYFSEFALILHVLPFVLNKLLGMRCIRFPAGSLLF